MNKKITCRPCKEKTGKWEIQEPDGKVNQNNFATKEECVKSARKMCEEFGAELCIENQTKSNK